MFKILTIAASIVLTSPTPPTQPPSQSSKFEQIKEVVHLIGPELKLYFGEGYYSCGDGYSYPLTNDCNHDAKCCEDMARQFDMFCDFDASECEAKCRATYPPGSQLNNCLTSCEDTQIECLLCTIEWLTDCYFD